MKARKGDKVQISFVGRFKDGVVFERSLEDKPLEFVVGCGEVLEGLDRAVLGMKLDEEKTIEIPCEEGYGPRRDDLVIAIPKSTISKDLNPFIGEVLVMKMPDGDRVPAMVRDVKEDAVIMDANPPFAGKDLVFDIKLVGLDSP
ncbi:MAG: FKBP-type peptidyl-prolyl cis-trans isomerase [Candidatus Altiarchaeota archaeon]|nr:FKBP-type peptidyl-prolyl cis-trans isomerase [Candidatus Altiarchaeota archaeon]